MPKVLFRGGLRRQLFELLALVRAMLRRMPALREEHLQPLRLQGRNKTLSLQQTLWTDLVRAAVNQRVNMVVPHQTQVRQETLPGIPPRM